MISSRNLPSILGWFLGGIFLLLGLIGTSVFGPNLLRWYQSASWEQVPGEIVSGELVSTNSARGGRTVRPHFVWTYEAAGSRRTGEGLGIARISTNDLAYAEEKLAQFPAGNSIEVLVNPRDPDDSILEREPVSHLVVLFVPPFFVLLGMIGLFFTFTAHLGWYRSDTQNFFGKFIRALFAFLLIPTVMKCFVISAFALVCLALALWSFTNGNSLGVILALVLAFGLWQAMRSGAGRRPHRPRGKR